MFIFCIALIVIPIYDYMYRWMQGKTYRKVRDTLHDDPIARLILKQVKPYYEVRWTHVIPPAIGLLLLALDAATARGLA